MNLKKLYKSIKTSPIYKTNRDVLLWDVEYTFRSFWKPFYVYIKKGFEFDWASVPRLFHIIWTPKWNDTFPGALFHDYLYRKQYTTREQADQCFNELMIDCEVRFLKRVLFYLWVRIGWWVAWRQNKKTLQSKKKW